MVRLTVGSLVGVDTNYSAYYLYPLSLCCWPDAGGLFVIYDARLTYSLHTTSSIEYLNGHRVRAGLCEYYIIVLAT
jgi:hypothetical protein